MKVWKAIARVTATATFFACVSAFGASSALALEWVPAAPATSCAAICSARGTQPVSSGTDGSGYQFFVCAGVAQNGEQRPGFNIDTSPDSSKLCLFEYGGQRGQSPNYTCLCQ